MNPYPNTGYQGLHLNFISPYGQQVELQVHSEESFAAKQEGHALYEQIRVSGRSEKKEELLKEINEIHGRISKPKGYLAMQDFTLAEDKAKKIINERLMMTDVSFDQVDMRPKGQYLAMKYEVTYNDKTKMSGFEHVYSDGSARSYQYDHETGKAKYCCVTETGKEIETLQVVPREFTLEEVVDLAKRAEASHKEFVKTHLQEHEKEATRQEPRRVSEIHKNDTDKDLR